MGNPNPKVAVILCGSGFKDGSEIRESVGTLWALSEHGAEFSCFAPNEQQKDVVNTYTGESTTEVRNSLVEAARIARGQIQPLQEFSEANFDAVIFPGGFGVAKNLCTFATQGSKASVHTGTKKVIDSMVEAKKPIGAICISPALVGLALKDKKLRLTLGASGEASQEIEKLGHEHVECPPNDCVVDETHKLVTTPAYMYDDAPLNEIFAGIKKCVAEVLKLA